MGKYFYGVMLPAQEPVITCQCIRVPVLNGQTAVFVKFRKKPTKDNDEALKNFRTFPQELEPPSAPKQFIQIWRTQLLQVTEDVNYEHGMGVSSDVSVRIPYTIINLWDCPTIP